MNKVLRWIKEQEQRIQFQFSIRVRPFRFWNDKSFENIAEFLESNKIIEFEI